MWHASAWLEAGFALVGISLPGWLKLDLGNVLPTHMSRNIFCGSASFWVVIRVDDVFAVESEVGCGRMMILRRCFPCTIVSGEVLRYTGCHICGDGVHGTLTTLQRT